MYQEGFWIAVAAAAPVIALASIVAQGDALRVVSRIPFDTRPYRFRSKYAAEQAAVALLLFGWTGKP